MTADTKTRILIVDDERSLRLTFRYALNADDMEIREAEDGESALECLHQDSFDLVFLDQQLPGMNGVDVLRTMRERGDLTPVVAVSAYGTPALKEQVADLGCLRFLHKPVTPDQLRRVVHDVLNDQD